MNFDSFWRQLQIGGHTPKGDRYRIDGDRLHIQTSGSRNEKYHITRETVRRYFEEIPQMSGPAFRHRFSNRFYRVYAHVTGEPDRS